MASNAGDTNPDPNSEEGGGPAHNTDASLLGQALDPPLLALAFFEHLLTAHAVVIGSRHTCHRSCTGDMSERVHLALPDHGSAV